MGSISSKSKPPATDVDDSSLDPRSPTPDVMRTPLNKDNAGSKQKITKNADLTKTLEKADIENKLIRNNPILSAVIRNHLQSYDPRSPTQDFERTPITLPSKKDGIEDMNIKHNGYNGSVCFDNEGEECCQDIALISQTIPKNLSEGFLDSTLESVCKDPEPLGSSTASQDSIEKDTLDPSPEGLLETNFDYVETSEEAEKYKTNDNETPVQLLQNAFKTRFNVAEIDPRSPSQGIERTPIVVTKAEGTELLEEVEEMTEERLMAALQNGIADYRRTSAVIEDKNLGLLIYEDDILKAEPLTPRRAKSASKGARTPLSCVKNKTEERSKSAAAVVDTKKKAVSRIPKRVSTVSSMQRTVMIDVQKSVEGHFENTPPRANQDAWDKDSSVIL